jgi:two-component system, NarL family, invasion response regulator UvrY
MIRIIIADDHAVMRLGTKLVLAEEVDFEIVAEAADAAEVMQRLRSCPCDVLLLDLNMPKRNGMDLLKEIKLEFPALAVLVLSMHPVEHFGVRTMHLGASGYLCKEGEPELIPQAIRIAASGRKYVSPALAQLLAAEIDINHQKPLHEILSDREYTVVRLIASGKAVGQIAEILTLSVKTVSNYRARALEKMNMQTNSEVMSYFYKNGLIS